MKPRLLDLFCCAGGAARGFAAAGFDVVGVDIDPQPNYPYPFAQLDALQALHLLLYGRGIHFEGERRVSARLDDFDYIHASPPCQAYTGLNNDKSKHVRLIAPVRELLEETSTPYSIENVEQARGEMRHPVTLHGWHFGLNVARKRLFETNWPLPAPATWGEPEREFLVFEHGHWRWTKNVPVYGTGGRKAVEYWPYAMGLGSTWDDVSMTRAEVAESIPPAYAEYVGRQFLQATHSTLKGSA